MKLNLKTQGFGFEVSTVELPKGYMEAKIGSFETMVMGYKGEWLDYQERYHTLIDAVNGHCKAITFVKELYEKEINEAKMR